MFLFLISDDWRLFRFVKTVLASGNLANVLRVLETIHFGLKLLFRLCSDLLLLFLLGELFTSIGHNHALRKKVKIAQLPKAASDSNQIMIRLRPPALDLDVEDEWRSTDELRMILPPSKPSFRCVFQSDTQLYEQLWSLPARFKRTDQP